MSDIQTQATPEKELEYELPDSKLYLNKLGLNALVTKIKALIPTSLKCPNKLTFTGATTATYDGSEALTVNIPSEGGSSSLKPLRFYYSGDEAPAGSYDGTTAETVYIPHTEPIVIWSGSGSYMNASQSVDLSDNPVFETSYGILLHWQYYNSGTKDQNHQFTFIPKTAVDDTSRGFMCNLQSINVSTGAVTGAGKYIYITNDAITGAACNAMSNNAHFVLTEVLAV